MIKRYICFRARLSWKDFHYIDYMEMTFMMSMEALFYMKFFSILKIILKDAESSFRLVDDYHQLAQEMKLIPS